MPSLVGVGLRAPPEGEKSSMFVFTSSIACGTQRQYFGYSGGIVRFLAL